MSIIGAVGPSPDAMHPPRGCGAAARGASVRVS